LSKVTVCGPAKAKSTLAVEPVKVLSVRATSKAMRTGPVSQLPPTANC
jgi:hypothetical protein